MVENGGGVSLKDVLFANITWDALTFIIGFIHLAACPYTKVEESFNVQAVHDMHYHFTDIDAYDHLEFPGSVPRTFVGPLIISLCLIPFRYITRVLHLSKFWTLFAGRLVTLCFTTYSISSVRTAFMCLIHAPLLNPLITIIFVSQFHTLFYGSRLLANTFAMMLINEAFANLMWSFHELGQAVHVKNVVTYLAIATIVFRCDTIVLAIPMLMACVWKKPKHVWRMVAQGVKVSLIAIVGTICIDSTFWKRLCWAELEVFYFNVIENRSSEWGTSPWYFYFANAIPRSMCFTILLIPLALLKNHPITAYEIFSQKGKLGPLLHKNNLAIFLIIFIYITLYSFLPHKELRFILPIVPTLTCLAGFGFYKAEDKQYESGTLKYYIHKFLSMSCRFAITISMVVTFLFLFVTRSNYPGGEAMVEFHKFINQHDEVFLKSFEPKVHIGNLAAQTGASRFGEESSFVIYDKKENIPKEQLHDYGYDWLITEFSQVPGYVMVSKIQSFKGIDPATFSPLFVDTLYILKDEDYGLRLKDPLEAELQDKMKEMRFGLEEDDYEPELVDEVENFEIPS